MKKTKKLKTSQFTQVRPSGPGWYWMRGPGMEVQIVKLEQRQIREGREAVFSRLTGPGLARIIHPDEISDQHEWCGPVASPQN